MYRNLFFHWSEQNIIIASDGWQKGVYEFRGLENITLIVDTWMERNEILCQHIAVDIKPDFVFAVKNKTQRAY